MIPLQFLPFLLAVWLASLAFSGAFARRPAINNSTLTWSPLISTTASGGARRAGTASCFRGAVLFPQCGIDQRLFMRARERSARPAFFAPRRAHSGAHIIRAGRGDTICARWCDDLREITTAYLPNLKSLATLNVGRPTEYALLRNENLKLSGPFPTRHFDPLRA